MKAQVLLNVIAFGLIGCSGSAVAASWAPSGATAVTSQDGWDSSAWFVSGVSVRMCHASGPDAVICTANAATLPNAEGGWSPAGAASMRAPGTPEWYSFAWFKSGNGQVALCRNAGDVAPVCHLAPKPLP